MSRITLTPIDEDFIFNNHKTMLVRKISSTLNVSVDAIRVFLKENNLPTFSFLTKVKKTKELSFNDQQYILDHYTYSTVSVLAKKINNTHYAVALFLKKQGLTPYKKLTIYKPPKKIIYINEQPTVKIQRPPAIYSNKQFI